MPAWVQVALLVAGAAMVTAAALLTSIPLGMLVGGAWLTAAALLSPDAPTRRHRRGGAR